MYEIRIMTMPAGFKKIVFRETKEEAIEEAKRIVPNLLETGFDDRIATGVYKELGIKYIVDVTWIGP